MSKITQNYERTKEFL